MKKLLSLLLALAMVFTLAACGSSKDSGKKDDKEEEEEAGISGKYLLVSVEEDGEEMSKEDMEEEYGKGSYIEIEEDGTAVMKIDGDKMDMEWEDDEIWAADDEDEKFELDINEKKGTVTITLEDNGEITLIFEKESDEEETEETEEPEETEDTEAEKPVRPAKPTEPEIVEPETTEPEYVDPTEPEEDKPVVGDIYYFYSMTSGETTYYLSDLAAEIGEEAAKTYVMMEITGDGTAILTTNGNSQEMEFADGLIWPVDQPDDKAGMGMAGDFIAISSGGYSFSLKK